MFDIIAVGSATRDVFLKSKVFSQYASGDSKTGRKLAFPLGSKLEIEEMTDTSGGGGTNASVTFARQEFNVACVSVLGKDYNGEEILRELQGEGVDISLMQRHDDGLTAYSVILVDESAERTILSYKGEGQHFGHTNIPFDEINAKWFYLDSLGGSYELFEKLVARARVISAKIACNPGGKELAHGWQKLEPLLKGMEYFSCNKEEASDLTGEREVELMLAKLKEVVSGVVIISDGPNGIDMADGAGKRYKADVPDSPVIERTGAGDAFASGFITEYMRSRDIQKSAQFGTANASSVVTKFGSKAGILKKGDWGQWPLVEVRAL